MAYAMRKLELIVIHCSATPNGRPTTVADIDGWHKKRGFAMIGYHYVIYVDGSIHEGRPLAKIGAHASGYNARSIGICMVGTDEFTKTQWDSLESLVNFLKEKFSIHEVVGHRMLPDVHKDCPGFNVAEWMADDKMALAEHILIV